MSEACSFLQAASWKGIFLLPTWNRFSKYADTYRVIFSLRDVYNFVNEMTHVGYFDIIRSLPIKSVLWYMTSQDSKQQFWMYYFISSRRDCGSPLLLNTNRLSSQWSGCTSISCYFALAMTLTTLCHFCNRWSNLVYGSQLHKFYVLWCWRKITNVRNRMMKQIQYWRLMSRENDWNTSFLSVSKHQSLIRLSMGAGCGCCFCLGADTLLFSFVNMVVLSNLKCCCCVNSWYDMESAHCVESQWNFSERHYDKCDRHRHFTEPTFLHWFEVSR